MRNKNIYIFILSVILASFKLNGQNIFIIGKLKHGDIEKVDSLIDLIDTKFKFRKLSIHFQGDKRAFIHRKNQPNSMSVIDRRLLAHASYCLTLTSKEIEAAKKAVPNSGRAIFVFDAQASSSRYQFNSFDKLRAMLESLKSTEKFDLVLGFMLQRPIVKITSPVNGGFYTGIIEGATQGEDISHVEVRINNTEWIKTNGTNYWTFHPGSEPNVFLVEARAINKIFDTSIIASSENLKIKEFYPGSLSYLYPNKTKKIVPKCRNNSGQCFNFKISVEHGININMIEFIITDYLGRPLYSSTLGKFPINSIRVKPRDGMDEYCLFLIYSALGFINPCMIDDSTPYYYYYKYLNPTGENVTTDSVKIYFGSFDSNFYTDYPECDCD